MPASSRWRPPSRSSSFRFWIGLLAALVVAWQLWSAGDPVAPVPPPGTTVVVRRAVDGDTLLLEDGQRVRLLGVDTPETKREGTPVQPWGPEAHEFTARLVEGHPVRLEFDRERTDKYGRVLAYVYRDEVLLNEELLREGLGRALLQHPYSEAMKRRFRQAEADARQHHRGIWSSETKPTDKPRRKEPARSGAQPMPIKRRIDSQG